MRISVWCAHAYIYRIFSLAHENKSLSTITIVERILHVCQREEEKKPARRIYIYTIDTKTIHHEQVTNHVKMVVLTWYSPLSFDLDRYRPGHHISPSDDDDDDDDDGGDVQRVRCCCH